MIEYTNIFCLLAASGGSGRSARAERARVGTLRAPREGAKNI